MKRILTYLAVLFIAGFFSLNAQNNAAIHFEKMVHDFGRIKEEGGKVTFNFKFRNTGKQPIVIRNVQSTCGCTTPEWTKTPIVPGKEGLVSAEYDPTGRPGAFSKQIMVYNNITSEPIALEIKGDVIPKTKGVEDIYRYSIGDLRLVSNHVAFARIFSSEKKTQSIDVVNNTDKPLTIGVLANTLGRHLTVNASPNVLKPKQTGRLVVEYDASKKDGWGFVTDRVILTINGTSVQNFPLSVSASVVEDFSKLSPAELANAPTMDFSQVDWNFGTIKQGQKADYEFKFKNNGKRDLIIRDIQTSCGCTAVDTKRVVKPGESSAIKVTFHSEGKSGPQNRSITLITNIPGQLPSGADKFRVVLRVRGEVQ
jgi:hypothetical protein